MDNGLMDKVGALLSDPDMASRIASVAGSVSGSGGGPDPRVALLMSVKPLLREDKRGKVDKLINAMTVISAIGGVRRRGI